MKNTFTKIALLVLSFALLACIFVGFANAEDAPAEDYKILSQNVIYNDNVSIVYAVDVSVEDAKAGNVKVAYYWEGDDTVYNAVLLDTTVADNLYNDTYPCFATTGVAPKALGKVAYATVYNARTGDAPAAGAADVEWKSYSVAEYLYARLYKMGFVNKTESDGKDYNRKLLYQNLLDYAANAQFIFDYEAEELVNDYSYIYTTSENITFDGKKTVFGYGELQVNATVVGEGTIAGWTLTDVDGAETTLETVTLIAKGIYKVDPIFGVHECVDTDPSDHLCDSCGEKTSDCATTDGDHICDLCGKLATKCADGNADGKCDTCGAYTFDSTVNTTESIVVSHVQGNNTKASAAGSLNTVQTSITEAARDAKYSYGTYFSLAKDPTDAANTVINIHTKQFTSGSSAAPASIVFNTSDAAGAYSVFETDLYIESGIYSNNRYYFDVMYFHIGGTSNGTKLTWYQTSTKKEDSYQLKFAGQALTNGCTDSWIKYKVVCDSANYYAYYSVDGGATYTLITSAAHNAGAVPSAFLVQVNNYYVNYNANLDNTLVKNANSVSIPLTDGTVATYSAN